MQNLARTRAGLGVGPVLAALLALGLAACGSTPSIAAPSAADMPAFGPPDGASEDPGSVGYRLGPDDVLLVSVRQDEELEREVRIDGKGNVRLAKVEEPVKAAGLTIDELRDAIGAAYRRTGIRNPEVDITVKVFGSQRVALFGQVQKPGVVVLQGRRTLVEILAEAGGLTDTADAEDIVVARMIGGRRMGARYDLTVILTGGMADPQIYAGDTVIVGASALQAFFKSAGQAFPVLSLVPGL